MTYYSHTQYPSAKVLFWFPILGKIDPDSRLAQWLGRLAPKEPSPELVPVPVGPAKKR